MVKLIEMCCANFFPAAGKRPISPKRYQKMIGAGFSTNWLKSKEPLKEYSVQNIKDVNEKGFTNLRLRCRADLYSYNYSAVNFTWFLGNLTTIVDDCLKHKVIPIISWIHHEAEVCAAENDYTAYVNWWTAVARQLKDRDFKLSFNLFTELGIGTCPKTTNSDESLRKRNDKYTRWTKDAIYAIRQTGGKNAKRILILGSPGKTAKNLNEINQSIYEHDKYLMAEWHIYASGPNKEPGSQKFWAGDGTAQDTKKGATGQDNVKKAINYATEFQKNANNSLLTYLGAWMPQDNQYGKITQEEAINFARFFVTELGNVGIPWSMNVLDRYYDTEESRWLREKQNISGQILNMYRVLEKIIEVMPKRLT